MVQKKANNMLELQNITYIADGKTILNNISVMIDERFVAITGPNGGGKSTLAKIIMGIDTPTSGKILLDGEDITSLSISERAAKGISYAFQQPVRFKGLQVKDLLQLAAGKEIKISEACDYLSEVGLCARDYIDRELNATLSGGELKRIEIAMALARGTKLSIFDEPEAGIDLWSFQNLIHVFEQMHQRTQGTILIISHQERILNIADKLLYVKAGVLEQYGTREEVLPRLLGAAGGACSVLTEKLAPSAGETAPLHGFGHKAAAESATERAAVADALAAITQNGKNGKNNEKGAQ